MKRTKLLALALAGVMALTLLTGCSDSSSKAKQVEECFRSLMKQRGDYQKDETLDKSSRSSHRSSSRTGWLVKIC